MTALPLMRPQEISPDPLVLARRITTMADGISHYLHGTLEKHGRFPARSFYGESFAALLLGQPGSLYLSDVPRLQRLYREKDHEDSQFHWEFNNYAWSTLYRETGNEAAKRLALPLRFRNTPATNWVLLRSCTRWLMNLETSEASQTAMDVLQHSQSRSGLICDQRNVRSFQYHCFSTVLVAELHGLSQNSFFLDRFHRAANFIEHFVLRSGDTLYIGRGQEQSFGYGSLICLLAMAARQFEDRKFLVALARCLSFLENHQSPDGSFPLVMNGNEEGYPHSAASSDPRFPGWYAYNNYFDYLPFLGVFLRKAADTLEGVSNPLSTVLQEGKGYRDRDFLVFRNDHYEAVLSRPGGGWKGGDGYWTNDLPFPYVAHDGVRLTPSYGGEQFGSTLYSTAGIPLPWIERKGRKKALRSKRVWSCFWGNYLIVLFPKGLLVRRFQFLIDTIIVNDFHLGLGKTFARFLFDGVQKRDDLRFSLRGGAQLEFSNPMAVEHSKEYYWGGSLQVLIARKPSLRSKVLLRLAKQP